jgi:excisionase family DNA binding protein
MVTHNYIPMSYFGAIIVLNGLEVNVEMTNHNGDGKSFRGSKYERERRLLTNQQFCDSLGMSEEWGRKRIQRGEIAVVRIGRSVRIPVEERDRIIDANLVPAEVR